MAVVTLSVVRLAAQDLLDFNNAEERKASLMSCVMCLFYRSCFLGRQAALFAVLSLRLAVLQRTRTGEIQGVRNGSDCIRVKRQSAASNYQLCSKPEEEKGIKGVSQQQLMSTQAKCFD